MKTKREVDDDEGMSRPQAETTAVAIWRYWSVRGYLIDVRAERIENGSIRKAGGWCVRSNLRNGLPIGYQPPQTQNRKEVPENDRKSSEADVA